MWNKQVKAEENAQSSSSNVEENNNFNNPETNNGSKHRKQYEVNEAPALNNILPPYKTSKAINQHVSDIQEEVYKITLAYNIN